MRRRNATLARAVYHTLQSTNLSLQGLQGELFLQPVCTVHAEMEDSRFRDIDKTE